MAMQKLGGKCVFSSEWDHQAKKTYEANFGEVPFGDITKQSIKDFVPHKFDVLCAGFPCQAFFNLLADVEDLRTPEELCFSMLPKSLKSISPKPFFLKM